MQEEYERQQEEEKKRKDDEIRQKVYDPNPYRAQQNYILATQQPMKAASLVVKPKTVQKPNPQQANCKVLASSSSSSSELSSESSKRSYA